MTKEIETTIEDALAMQERLVKEYRFIEDVMGKAPDSLLPALREMVAVRYKAYLGLEKMVRETRVVVPPEAVAYIAVEPVAESVPPIEEEPIPPTGVVGTRG